MANELTLTATAAYEDAFGVTASIVVPSLFVTLSQKKPLHTKQTVGTSEEALIVGDITTRRLCVLVNRDETNIVNVKVGTGGAIFATLDPNGINWCIVPLGSGAQSPFVIALVAECELEILICGA